MEKMIKSDGYGCYTKIHHDVYSVDAMGESIYDGH